MKRKTDEEQKLDVSHLEVEASLTPASVLIAGRVRVDDPLPADTHPYRPSVERVVAVLCSDPKCDRIYAVETEAHDGESSSPAHDCCPRCGAAGGFPVRRVIHGIDEPRVGITARELWETLVRTSDDEIRALLWEIGEKCGFEFRP